MADVPLPGGKIGDLIIGLAGFLAAYYSIASLDIAEKTFAFLIIVVVFITTGILSLNK
ncbi:hypothetical protein GW924_02355 [Candidatus Pacearchaeota archaeon]|nr:hypothetical protein [Candidatus Pacearchaeota archaeon]